MSAGPQFDRYLADLKSSAWYKDRPAAIKAAIEKRPPNTLYRMDTGHVCYIHSYTEGPKDECHEVKVIVSKKYNHHLAFERCVFGIPLDELVPTEAPPAPPACEFCDRDECHVSDCGKKRSDRSGTYCEPCLENFIDAAKQTLAGS